MIGEWFHMVNSIKRKKDSDLQAYLLNPCGSLSLPRWKTKQRDYYKLADRIDIIHGRDIETIDLKTHVYDRYFRIIHDLEVIPSVSLSKGYEVITPTAEEFKNHINTCYNDITISDADILKYMKSSVYREDLWLAVIDKDKQAIIASGIAEYDNETQEGVIEWIQVSENYRKQGFGFIVVNELLICLKKYARFVTVSGNVDNPNNPEQLYRKCGFKGDDIWYIVQK